MQDGGILLARALHHTPNSLRRRGLAPTVGNHVAWRVVQAGVAPKHLTSDCRFARTVDAPLGQHGSRARSAHAMVPTSNPSPFTATDPGFVALPVTELLASAEALVSRIRLCFGLCRESFDCDVQPLLHAYAAYVHLLPATAGNYFSAPGGLLRLGLEVAFFSLQGTDAHIFSGRSTISARRQLEPRWRHATFIAGLCCELHRVLSHMIVTDQTGSEWPAYLEPLSGWLTRRQSQRYFLRWRPNAIESRGLGIFAMPLIVPARVMQHLSDDNTVIVPHLMASAAGLPVYRDHNVLDGLVRRSLALVIDRNLQADANRYGAPQFGSHLERYLVDALRRLASSDSNWVPNREKSRAWFGIEGLFLVWPQAATDLQALLEADELAGVPKSHETVLELLLAAGAFESQEDGRPTWTILPPGTRSPVEAVKLSSPAILLGGLDSLPQPLAKRLVCMSGEGQPTARELPAQPAPPPGTQYSLLEPTSAVLSASVTAVPAPLPSPIAASPESPAMAPESPPPPAPLLSIPRPAFKLNAPLRLNPVVRNALAAIVDTLSGPADAAAARMIANGLFVPLREWERRGVQPASAVRALEDVQLLVRTDHRSPATVSRDFGGEQVVGLILLPRCVDGFDPEAILPTSTAGH